MTKDISKEIIDLLEENTALLGGKIRFEQDLPKKLIKKTMNKEECKHNGYWKPLGQSTRTSYKDAQNPSGAGYYSTPFHDEVVVSVYCKNCGEVRKKII